MNSPPVFKPTVATILRESETNFHATLVRLARHGVLIEGRSGAGKTSLAHGLIERFEGSGTEACFVSDDQVFLSIEKSGSVPILVGTAPESIAGKAEIYGLGITEVDHVERSTVDMVVKLVPDVQIERMPELESVCLLGISLPVIRVPERHEAQAIRIVCTKLSKLFG